ncbi:hypothetical protein [Leifsonia sp. AG29]|uniref:hypothetical protein n=1 Tax=Leifsonia sp. AG29 TaxID=2598860 RepID=UPI00131BD20A|nr:hypothetical protein [Leifsonia sp. AG29]
MPRRRLRAVGVLAAFVAGGMLLTGCVPTAGGASGPKTTAASPRTTTKPPKPKAETRPEKVSRAESGYTWTNSRNVGLASEPSKPAFLNHLATSPDWEVVPESTRMDAGQWVYKSKTNTCEISLFQGAFTDVASAGSDDRAYTLDVYRALLGEHFAADQITESRIGYGVNKAPQPGDPGVDGLSFIGNGNLSVWARGFTSIGMGLIIVGMCGNAADLPTVTDTIHEVGVVNF